jgi:hypothetical protein
MDESGDGPSSTANTAAISKATPAKPADVKAATQVETGSNVHSTQRGSHPRNTTERTGATSGLTAAAGKTQEKEDQDKEKARIAREKEAERNSVVVTTITYRRQKYFFLLLLSITSSNYIYI